MFIVLAIHSSQLPTSTSTVPSESGIGIDDKADSGIIISQPMSNIQKTRKRSTTYQVSIDIKYFKQSLKSGGATSVAHEQHHSEYIKPSLVTMEFLDIKVQLQKVLQFCEPKNIINKCGSLLANESYNIPLFTSNYAEKLQQIEHTPELIQKLSPFMTWDNHSILSTIADTSNIPEATMLLTQFDNRIDSSQPLTSFPIPAPSYHMVPYDNSTHTVLAVKLDLELYHSTLQTVIDARSLIQDQCKLTSYCLQLLAIAKTDFTIIYWMIPKVVAAFACFKVLENLEIFHQNGILQMALYPGSVLLTNGTLTVGPLSSFLYQTEKSVSLQ